MRIGVIRDERIVNSLYRAVMPMDALARRGHTIVWAKETSNGFDLSRLSSCDLVYIHRHFDGYVQRVARTLRERGVALWWDNDDDITAVPRDTPMYRRVGGVNGSRIFAGMTRMMAMADLVSTPSAMLSARYRQLGIEDVWTLENYVADDYELPRGRKRHDVVSVGWVAAAEHRRDADSLRIRETLGRLLDARPSVEVVSIGIGLGLAGRYRHTAWLPLHDLAAATAEFDVGIAPLTDTRLNQARSDVKLKEYAAAGVPWLASPIGPYSSYGEKQGGRLVADDSWLNELARLVDDKRLRRRLARRASRWGSHQTIDRNVARWEEAMEAALAHAARRRVGFSAPRS